jgi:hypothetical protein
MLECIEAAYDRGYKSGINDGNINDGTFDAKVKEAYDNGLNDAWECAKRIYEMPCDAVCELFPDSNDVIFADITASEAIKKIREYDEKKAERNASPDNELHIGDEVYSLDKNSRKTVTAIDGNTAIVLCTSGKCGVFRISGLHKTGRRFAIDEVLRKLKE